MTNILVRKADRGPTATPVPFERDPFHFFRDFFRWDPFREMGPLFPAAEAPGTVFSPAFEVKETKEGYLFKADVPGMKESDLEVTLTGNRLTVAGKREAEKEEKTDTYFTYERSYGSFTRAFTLPDGVDSEHLRAELKEGVLTLVLPKKPEAQPRTVPVKTGAAPKS